MALNYIYAYTHDGHRKKWSRPSGQSGDFWVKVGQTGEAGLGRVRRQLRTPFPNLDGVEVFFHSEVAQDPQGKTFSDNEVHQLLMSKGVQNEGGEWFSAHPEEVLAAIVSLRNGTAFENQRFLDFEPRPEQEQAVNQTAAYFREHPKGPENRYLWNAKMRFGKTFTTYQLALEMGWKRVLVLTYKPAVRDAWRDDLLGHVDFAGWRFVDRSAPRGVAEAEFKSQNPLVCFASFQDVTGSDLLGKAKPRNEILSSTNWDCIVIDEFHFGASTDAAREIYDPQDRHEVAMAKVLERALNESNERTADVLVEPDRGLKTKYHLHLSGTPFRAITNGTYSEDQVFNWTYIDEQKAKSEWPAEPPPNPYKPLPQVRMYTYQLGESATEIASEGEFDGFNLNTFFKAHKKDGDHQFERPNDVRAFLDLIRGKKGMSQRLHEGKSAAPFPYQAEEFAGSVQHSIWYLNDIAACEAMAAMLREDGFYSHYEIYVAAGSKAKIGAAALLPLQKAIKRSSDQGKSGSITLSCGKLMTGVTVPEWSAIFMLKSLKAPESYFQAAFRIQSPWVENGEVLKDQALIFEFDPNRAFNLVALYGTELAGRGNLGGSQRSALTELINYLPIFAVDGGYMEELDVQALLDWAHAGTSANSLARRWGAYDLYNLNESSMSRILDDEELMRELEQIEDFRNVRSLAESIISNSKKLKKLKVEQVDKPAQTPARKAIAKQRRDLREKLRKINAKVLMFMYLTDFREEDLEHVIGTLDTDLFLRSTGLSIASYRKLVDMGVIVQSTMTDAIQKFRYFEKTSIKALLAEA